MKVFIVYCHPSRTSFTYEIYESFKKGLTDAGHEVIVSDLYEMDFRTDLSEEEYLRESYYKADAPLPADVIAEQEKIQSSDAVVFIYPVFWTEAPAKLVGWFDRVWTTGFAYSPNPSIKTLDKALAIACAGKTLESLIEVGEKDAMETVMLGDRIRSRAKESRMVIYDGITHWDEENRKQLAPQHIAAAYELGRSF